MLLPDSILGQRMQGLLQGWTLGPTTPTCFVCTKESLRFLLRRKATIGGFENAPFPISLDVKIGKNSSYANLTMGYIEEQLLFQQNIPKPLLWLRFIDDIFLIWVESKESFEIFFEALKAVATPLNFTHVISSEGISFLDVNLTLSEGMLSTSV